MTHHIIVDPSHGCLTGLIASGLLFPGTSDRGYCDSSSRSMEMKRRRLRLRVDVNFLASWLLQQQPENESAITGSVVSIHACRVRAGAVAFLFPSGDD